MAKKPWFEMNFIQWMIQEHPIVFLILVQVIVVIIGLVILGMWYN